MADMNRSNVLTAQRFNPPTVHQSTGDGACAGICYVYDPAAWRNRNKRRPQASTKPVPHSDKAPKAAARIAPKYGHGFEL